MALSAYLITPAYNLEMSEDFYSRLGFEMRSNGEIKYFTDGRLNIILSDHQFARQGLCLISDDWTSVIKDIEAFAKVKRTDEGYIVVDPNGVKVYLLEKPSLEVQKDENVFGKLGNFSGLTIESADFESSVEFWEKLNYKIARGGVDQGWVNLESDSGIPITFLGLESCPHMFQNPGLTYFNSGNNLEIIEGIKNANIEISQEITCFNKEGIADNVIIHDPGKTLFFIFND